MSYHGDLALGQTVRWRFTTVDADGLPTTLAGTPVLSAYEDDSATEITAGVSVSVDHDSRTGSHLVTVVATTGNGFEVGKDYTVLITTGTVAGASVVGYDVGSFSIENRSLEHIKDDGSATFDRTTDSLQAIRDRGDAAWIAETFATGTTQTGSNTTTLVLEAAHVQPDNYYKGYLVKVVYSDDTETSRIVTASSESGSSVTLDEALAVDPATTATYKFYPGRDHYLTRLDVALSTRSAFDHNNDLVSLDNDTQATIDGLPSAADIAAAIGAREPADITGISDLAAMTYDEIHSLVRMLITNKRTQDDTHEYLWNDAGDTAVLRWPKSDALGTFTKDAAEAPA